jgi:hypothetical protein
MSRATVTKFTQYRLSPDPSDNEVPAVSTDDCTITAAEYRRDIRMLNLQIPDPQRPADHMRDQVAVRRAS